MAAGPDDREPRRSLLSRWLLPGGIEPDPRFTLANERTFLAWIRTSLAFIGGGVALEAFVPGGEHSTLRTGVAFALVIVGIVVAGNAVGRWIRVERAMRSSRPLPVPVLVPVIALAVAMGAAAALVVLVG